MCTKKDAKALLIMSCLTAMAAHINQWWIGPPARAECKRQRVYLSRLEDLEMRSLLAEAADCCTESQCNKSMRLPNLKATAHHDATGADMAPRVLAS